MVRTTLPGASVEEIETQVSEIARGGGQHASRASTSCARSRRRVSRWSSSRSISIATSTPPRRTCATASPRCCASCRDDIEPPMISKQDSDNSPMLSIALSRQPVDSRADRDRRQDRQGAARALDRRRRSADRRRPRARDEHLGRSRSARRLPAPDHRGPRRAAAAERRRARRQRHHRRQRADAAHDGPLHRRRRSSTTSSIATRNGAPIRVRDIGRAEDGTKEQRSLARLNGVPTVVLDVRRQSGANTVAVIEAVKASLERDPPQLPAGRADRGRPRPVRRYIYASLHEINVHLVLGSILACLVVFAFMRDWRATIIAAVAIPDVGGRRPSA